MKKLIISIKLMTLLGILFARGSFSAPGIHPMTTPLCQNAGVGSLVGEIDFTNTRNIVSSACQLGGPNLAGDDARTIGRLAYHVSRAISSNSKWKNDPQVAEKIRDLMDAINIVRPYQMRGQRNYANNSMASEEDGLWTSMRNYASECRRGSLSGRCLSQATGTTPQQKKAAQMTRWNNYTTFLQSTARQSVAGSAALTAAQTRASQPPFQGLLIKPIPAALAEKGAQGSVKPERQSDGKLKLVIYINPQEDPLQAVSTLTHEAQHASTMNQQLVDDYNYTTQNGANYFRLQEMHRKYQRISRIMDSRVCFVPAGRACTPDNCNSGGSRAGSLPCPASPSGYLSKTGTRISSFNNCSNPNSFYCRTNAQKAQRSSILKRNQWVLKGCAMFTETNFRNEPCTGMAQYNALVAKINQLPASQQTVVGIGLQGFGISQNIARYQGEYEAETARLGFINADLPTSFYSNTANNGWRKVRDELAGIAPSFRAASRRISKHNVVDEYRAHKIGLQTLADLSVKYPSLVCQRSANYVNSSGKSIPLHREMENLRQQFMCGTYLCKQIALPYSHNYNTVRAGIPEWDIFSGDTWNLNSDIMTEIRGADNWRQSISGNQCRRSSGSTLPVQAMSGNCSPHVPNQRHPVNR